MMILNNKLFDICIDKATTVNIDLVSLGLGYTAVITSDGGIGISYTYFKDKKTCMVLNKAIDYEGRPADGLLKKIKSENTIEKSMALALVNALNYDDALKLPEDRNNTILLKKFKIQPATNVAMVGYFGPGKKKDFYARLGNWAHVLLLTSTSILNNTTEEILAKVHKEVKTVMLGPSTPMIAEAFEHLPVHMLAGTVPIDRDNVLKAVRHGAGTPVLHKFSRKSYLSLS
jgi:uncharacterized protein (DUF4213/DUF364 family)